MPLPSRALATGLGFGIIVIFLALWRLLGDPVELFSLSMALGGLLLWLASHLEPIENLPLPRLALLSAAVIAAILAVAAALSLGAFLHPTVAEIISPALGRFGAAGGLLLLVCWMLIALAGAKTQRRAGLLLDLAIAALFAAFWVSSEVVRQADFPPPPSTAALFAPRLNIIFWLSVVAAVLVGPTWVLSRPRSERPTSTDEPNNILNDVPATWSLLAGRLWRWSALAAIVGLIMSVLLVADDWYRFGAILLDLLVGAVIAPVVRRRGATVSMITGGALGSLGWLVVALIGVGTVYFSVSEDLEIVLLRNTAQWKTTVFWRSVLGDERLVQKNVGLMSGVIYNEAGQPQGGVTVLVSDASGNVYSAVSSAAGTYVMTKVPEGSYLPLAVAPGYKYTPPMNASGRVANVHSGKEARDVNFQLALRAEPQIAPDGQLKLGDPTVGHVDNPAPSDAVRRTFTFFNRDKLIEGGLVHEPPESMGEGPFPVLLVIFPGPASYWEGISIPLAASGYVVVSYFPVRLLDHAGDMSDLDLLLTMVAQGQLSERSDGGRIAIVGGSVSTAYTYRLALDMQGMAAGANVRAMLQYGGLFDMFHFRNSWERGDVIIDPGISDLEYLLTAFGRPDLRPEMYLYLSPRYTLGPGELPPTLLVHAGNDIIVPPDQSQIAADRLKQLDIDHDLQIYPNVEHYLDTSKRDPTQVEMLNRTLEFLDANMR